MRRRLSGNLAIARLRGGREDDLGDAFAFWTAILVIAAIGVCRAAQDANATRACIGSDAIAVVFALRFAQLGVIRAGVRDAWIDGAWIGNTCPEAIADLLLVADTADANGAAAIVVVGPHVTRAEFIALALEATGVVHLHVFRAFRRAADLARRAGIRVGMKREAMACGAVILRGAGLA